MYIPAALTLADGVHASCRVSHPLGADMRPRWEPVAVATRDEEALPDIAGRLVGQARDAHEIYADHIFAPGRFPLTALQDGMSRFPAPGGDVLSPAARGCLTRLECLGRGRNAGHARPLQRSPTIALASPCRIRWRGCAKQPRALSRARRTRDWRARRRRGPRSRWPTYALCSSTSGPTFCANAGKRRAAPTRPSALLQTPTRA